METSDSDFFESADEDISSDEEETKTVKNVTEKSNDVTDDVNSVINDLKDVKLSENTSSGSRHININTDNAINLENAPKDSENNIDSSREVTATIKKQSTQVPTVGEGSIKLSQKQTLVIKKVNKKEKETHTAENITLQGKVNTSENLEENLWDNSEIDWDDESDKKDVICAMTSESNDSSKEIKSEDNLWNDSEANWSNKNEDENMWDNDDDWEPVEQPIKIKEEIKVNESEPSPQKNISSVNTGWGSWGWDVSSILSTATQSVSTITQGITTVLETGIGVPEPEELARINHEEKEKLQDISSGDPEKSTGFGLGNLVIGVSHLTKLVETTGTKVISGGLDTLETIGKKTMEVLQEGDPGLKKKRAFLKIEQDKPVLSQLLREAKEKAENENKALEEKHLTRKAKNFETLFDDHQGLVYLEALEMLSKQCDIKLQTLLESYSDQSLIEMQETMDQVKELCELPDEEEDEQGNWTSIKEKLNSAVSEINIPISYKKIIETWEETEIWLNNLKLDVCDERELHQQAVETLAQLTANAVQQFHKAGELLLVKEHRSTADEADSLVQLTTSMTALIGIVAAKFSDKLNTKSSNCKNKDEVNGLITNVFYEAANSSSYIQDAFQLLIPVLQVGAV